MRSRRGCSQVVESGLMEPLYNIVVMDAHVRVQSGCLSEGESSEGEQGRGRWQSWVGEAGGEGWRGVGVCVIKARTVSSIFLPFMYNRAYR